MGANQNTNHSKGFNVFARNVWSGIFAGIGFIAFIDEVVFHQLLQWHHFYDRSTPFAGIFTDGLFHAFSWFATVAGLFMLADLRRRNAFSLKNWLGGLLIGAGAFQAYDGAFQHKILRIHQIRYVENVFWYDFVWVVSAIIMVLLGIYIATHSNAVQARKQVEAK